MHGWALGAVAAPGPHTWYIDDVALTVPETVVDDYEYTVLPSRTDADGLGLGFQTYAGNGGSASITPVDDARTAARPGEKAGNVVGWRFVQLEWSDFTEKNTGNGAPQDGLTLTEIHGYAFGAVSTDGVREYLLDRFAVWGDGLQDELLVVGFDRVTYGATEGSTVTVTATLSRVSDVAVTVHYATVDSGARTKSEDGAAIEGRDCTLTTAR